jgi:hypothetical protein
MTKNTATGTVTIVAAIFMGAIQALAATLSGVTGQVFINSGKGFVAAKDGATVNPGDVVMAREGASAKVVFADGTSLVVEAGKSLAVGTTAGLATGAGGLSTATLLVGAGAVAAGVGAAVILSNNDSKPSSP